MVEQKHSNINDTQNPENTSSFQLTVKKWDSCLVPPAAESTLKGSVYFLSNVDDDLTITRTLYCFKSDVRGNDGAAQVIKDALANVLVHYYPLAGRIFVTPEGKFAVNCNGEGVVFVEAEANCALEDVDFSRPDKVTRGKLVVYDVPGVDNKFDVPLAAQVTKFKCGGFILGISFNHLLADGQAAVEFIISWAETARGISPISHPPFLDRTILKARTPLQLPFRHPEFDSIEHKRSSANPFLNQPMVSEYLHFTPQMIETLKSKATPPSENRAPSTYEALSAYVWIARTKALKTAPDQLTKVLLVANTRSKFDPPLPKGYFGNAIKFTPALGLAAELVESPISDTVLKVREAIKRVNDDGYLRSAIDYYELTKAKRPRGFWTTFTATSWSRLDFEATDFGWGGAILTEPVEIPSDDTVVFLAHPTEKRSVNVFVALPVGAMEVFKGLIVDELCG
ncbi:Omega-hydroxypalmitate O-feruloyl transferase [Linum grandiflorum]